MNRIELRTPRWVHIPFLIADLVLLALFYQVVFGGGFSQGDAFTPADPPTLGFRLMFGLFMAIGVFMAGVFVYRIIKSPPTLVMDSEGIYLNPAGVSLGHFRWSEISEVKVTEVLGSPNGSTGPRVVPAVALVLKDPDAYIKRFPKLMSPLFKFRHAEAGTPLLLEPSMFGKRYEECLAAMRAQVEKHRSDRR